MTTDMQGALAAPLYLTVAEVRARYRGVSRSWVYSSIANGVLPEPVKFGSRVLFHVPTLEQFEADKIAASAATKH